MERVSETKSSALHFLRIFGLGAAIWTLTLRFFFPGYLDPFVPFHIDHFEYLGRSAEGYGVMRYFQKYPRPIGNLLFDLLGRLGTRGMLVPVFAPALFNAVLLIRYLERLIGRRISVWTMIPFFVLVFANPQSYASVKEDILAVASSSTSKLLRRRPISRTGRPSRSCTGITNSCST